MGLAGHPPYIDLDKALEHGDLPNAWIAAHERRGGVKLSQALRLTMLMFHREDSGYENAVRRFLVRFVKEEKPTLEQIRKVAHALEEMPKAREAPIPGSPEYALISLVRQLEERERERRRLVSS